MNAPETSRVFYAIYQVNKDYSGDGWKNDALLFMNSELKVDFIEINNIEFIPVEHDSERFNDESLNYYRLKIIVDQDIPLNDDMKEDWLKRHSDN
jgi:hypothetical protein